MWGGVGGCHHTDEDLFILECFPSFLMENLITSLQGYLLCLKIMSLLV